MQHRRSDARARAASPVEIAEPTVTPFKDGFELPCTCPGAKRVHLGQHWDGTAQQMLWAIAQSTGVAVAQMRSRSRERAAVAARRLALWTWTRELNRPAIHMARALGIAGSSAAGLLATTSQPVQLDAAELARTLREP